MFTLGNFQSFDRYGHGYVSNDFIRCNLSSNCRNAELRNNLEFSPLFDDQFECEQMMSHHFNV